MFHFVHCICLLLSSSPYFYHLPPSLSVLLPSSPSSPSPSLFPSSLSSLTQIWLDNVQCNGTENSIFQCNHSNWANTNCDHTQDASAICTSELALCKCEGVQVCGCERVRVCLSLCPLCIHLISLPCALSSPRQKPLSIPTLYAWQMEITLLVELRSTIMACGAPSVTTTGL